jgi:hypothetical protein
MKDLPGHGAGIRRGKEHGGACNLLRRQNLGFRGGGEGGITPSLGVIVNAIVDALAEFGVTHVEMPATAEKVWRAMRAGRTVSTGGTEAR